MCKKCNRTEYTNIFPNKITTDALLEIQTFYSIFIIG